VPSTENLTTFICRLFWNLGTSKSWDTKGLPGPVQGLLYLYLSLPLLGQGIMVIMVIIYCLHELPSQRNRQGIFMSVCHNGKRENMNLEKTSVANYDRNYSIYCGCSKVLELATTAIIIFWKSRSSWLSFSCLTEEERSHYRITGAYH